MSDIVERLRIKAGVMQMGERIEWGSDTALMLEAADRIEQLRAMRKQEPAAWLWYGSDGKPVAASLLDSHMHRCEPLYKRD